MLRLIASTVIGCALLAYACTVADARPKQTRTASQALIYCASDGTYRRTCGLPEKRIQSHRTASAGGSILPCKRVLDCGCSLARVIGISDRERARRLWVARSWLREFPRAPGPVKGAVAVMSRGKGGGHVGLVRGVDPNGNPIVESFKYHGSVGEAVYPKSRVLGYVWPS